MTRAGVISGDAGSGERFDVVTFGEALAVFHPQTPGPLTGVRSFDKGVGGAELNVAIGLARLGHRVAWIGRVGADPFGDEILATLRSEGIDVTHAQVDPHAPTGLYFKELRALGEARMHYVRDGTAASHTRPEDLHLATLKGARLLHLTGITPALSDDCRAASLAALDEACASGVQVSFDANLRWTLLADRDPKALLAPLLERSDLLFLAADESQVLLGDVRPGELQAILERLNAREIVVHDHTGAHAITNYAITRVCARPVTVLDSVGAGDAFVAGYLSGWLREWEPQDRLRLAEFCAASVITMPGDFAGAPTQADALAALDGPTIRQR